MIIPTIMHIHLAVILGMVIFPLAFLKFLLGLIWPKIKRKKPFWALFGQNPLWLTAKGKSLFFYDAPEIGKHFLFSSPGSVCTLCPPCAPSTSPRFSHFSAEIAYFGETAHYGGEYRQWRNARGKSDLIFGFTWRQWIIFIMMSWVSGHPDSQPILTDVWIIGVPSGYYVLRGGSFGVT